MTDHFGFGATLARLLEHRGLATALGFHAVDLSVLAGLAVPEAVGAVALLWQARRLSAVQARRVSERARSLRGGSRDGYVPNLPAGPPLKPAPRMRAA